MSEAAGLISKWERRIEELKCQNQQLESGQLKLREKRLSEDGGETENDLTSGVIVRNKDWIVDLEAVIVLLNQEQKVSR